MKIYVLVSLWRGENLDEILASTSHASIKKARDEICRENEIPQNSDGTIDYDNYHNGSYTIYLAEIELETSSPRVEGF